MRTTLLLPGLTQYTVGVVFAGLVMLAAADLVRAGEKAPLAAPGQIVVADGTLSVDLVDAPVAGVIAAIAAQSGIDTRVYGDFAAHRLTARFARRPFADGLERLLDSVPGVVIARSASIGYAGIRAVYVFDMGANTADALPEPTRPPAAAAPGSDAFRLAAEEEARLARVVSTLVERLDDGDDPERETARVLREHFR